MFVVKFGLMYCVYDGYYLNLYFGGWEGEFSYIGGYVMVFFDLVEWFEGLFVYDFI